MLRLFVSVCCMVSGLLGVLTSPSRAEDLPQFTVPVDLNTPKVEAPAEAPLPEDYAGADYPEALPIEISLIHAKLMNENPNLDYMVFSDPMFRDAKTSFSDTESIKQYRDKLQHVFSSFKVGKVIAISSFVAVKPTEGETGIVGIEPDLPYVYKMNDNDMFGVFILNAKDTFTLKPPFEQGGLESLASYKEQQLKKMPVQMIIRPKVADREPYFLENGETVKPLISEIVELRILSQDKRQILLSKRFKNWIPEVEKKSDVIVPPEGAIPVPPLPDAAVPEMVQDPSSLPQPTAQ
jgi:hypothetical protein